MRERGAIAWKVMLAVVATGGGILAATQLSSQPERVAPREITGATAPAPVTQTQAGDPSAAPGQSDAAAPANDPFAGVDVSNNSVLRHIAGIEEKARAKLGAKKANAQQADTNAARRATEAPPPAREDTAAASSTAVPVTAAPVEVVRPAATPSQTQPAIATAPEIAPPPAPLKAPAAVPAPASPPTAVERTLAAARVEPAPQPPQVAAPLRIVNRTVPDFPGEAIRAGVRQGRVVARLTIDAEGRVTATQLLSATPTGFFERESRRALSTWRYEPPGRETTTDVELVFNRE